MDDRSRAEVATMAVLVTNDFPPNHGGIQRFMSRLAHEMTVQKRAIVVVAPRLPGSDSYDATQTFRVVRYSTGSRLSSLVAMTSSLCAAVLRAPDRVILASMWFPGGLAACLIPRFIRGRFAVLAHGTEIAPTRAGLRRRVMQYVFARADVVIANSAFTRELLLAAGVRGTIRVVHPGIDAEPIPSDPAPAPVIISVGRLVARKGFDTIIASLPHVIAAFPNVRYEIVGSGPQRAELEELARRTGVAEHVVFLGAVSDDEMRAAYARAWCFALPVRAIGSDVEGFGLVYLEAALAGLATIGGRRSGAEDAIVDGQTGLLVDGMSTEAVAQALLQLLEDRGKSTEMGARGRERALAEFTWSRTAAQISALLDNGEAALSSRYGETSVAAPPSDALR